MFFKSRVFFPEVLTFLFILRYLENEEFDYLRAGMNDPDIHNFYTLCLVFNFINILHCVQMDGDLEKTVRVQIDGDLEKTFCLILHCVIVFIIFKELTNRHVVVCKNRSNS